MSPSLATETTTRPPPAAGEAGSFDAYTPAEIARRVRDIGVRKVNLDVPSMFALAVLAGAFIALGAALCNVASTHTQLGYGPSRLLGGVAFSLGLILVVVAGAELFTGNNLAVMAWAGGLVPTRRLLGSWAVVYAGNFVGAFATAVLFYLSLRWADAGAQPGATAVRVALAKSQLGFVQAFVLGVLCNALVCLAVWLAFGARSVADKILAIVPPITAFVALGFEHSIANMYILPLALLIKSDPGVLAAGGWSPADLAPLTWAAFLRTLLPVTLGNIAGGAGLVAGMYGFIYLRRKSETSR